MFHPSTSFVPSSEVILLGAGLCNLEVISWYKEQKRKLFRLTLINDSPQIAYHGRLSHLISRQLDAQDCLVDLGHLCADAGVRFVCDRVSKVDPSMQKIFLTHHHVRTLPYDAIAIDIRKPPKKHKHDLNLPAHICTPLYPLAKFIQHLEEIENQLKDHSKESPYHVVIMGIDEYSAELALALARRFKSEARSFNKISMTLVEPERPLRANLSPAAMHHIQRALISAGIRQIHTTTISGYDKHQSMLLCQDGVTILCDSLILRTTNKAPDWLTSSGLTTDEKGLFPTHQNLESKSHPGIYIVGDLLPSPPNIPALRNSTYYLKMGRLLARNLGRRFGGESEVDFNFKQTPITSFNLGNQQTLILWKHHCWKSSVAYRRQEKLADAWISQKRPTPNKILIATFIESGNLTHRPCSAAAATIPQDILKNFHRKTAPAPDIALGDSKSDGAKVIRYPQDQKFGYLVQSMGYLRAFSRNLNLLGRVAAQHSFNDLYALGTHPNSATVNVTVPFANKQTMDRDFNDLMSGILDSFSDDKILLAGTSSQMGQEAGVGITAQALIDESKFAKLWRPDQNKVGDSIILTNPIGSGILFAGHNSYVVSSRHLFDALEEMLSSHKRILGACSKISVSSASAVSAYGLAICLQDMTSKENQSIHIELDKIPVYSGALSAMAKGVRSSLHGQNRMPFTKSLQGLPSRDLILAEILFDPQTAGPLVLVVPKENSHALVSSLHDSGLTSACVIGEVVPAAANKPQVRLSSRN